MRRNAAAAALLLAGCAAHPIRDFTTDGCTLFPDGNWCDCCRVHDEAYWRGGTQEQREAADVKLRDCVLAKSGDKALAETMYYGVRGGGAPVFPTWYRWGYGWEYGRGYAPLSADEQKAADAKLAAYHATHGPLQCGAAR
ncbi:MAG TPA: hypothetical protein VHE37_10840 [Nevskiaceae bacterium]|nr:hypothetical protein [Nevskiaceae bacterium]